MREPFHAAITGLGMITPAGVGVAQNWDTVMAGQSSAALDPSLEGLPVQIACRVQGFDPDGLDLPNPWQWDRFSQFALVAAQEALRDAGLVPRQWADSSRVAVIVGSGGGGTATLEEQHAVLLAEGAEDISSLTLPMGLLNMAAGQLAIALGAQGPCFAPCSACASGATALGLGKELLRSGAADIVIAGGTEALITRFYVSAFARMRALSPSSDPSSASRPFDRDRSGFVIGEGAGILVLESPEHARRRGARVHGHLLGYGASADAHHVTSPHPQGQGAYIAMQAALADAGITPAQVGYINAHGTSTPGNDVVEAAAIGQMFGNQLPVSSTKGVTGHLLGAAGAIEAIYALLAAKQGHAPHTANLTYPDPKIDLDLIIGEPRRLTSKIALSNSFGFGGQNVSLVIGA